MCRPVLVCRQCTLLHILGFTTEKFCLSQVLMRHAHSSMNPRSWGKNCFSFFKYPAPTEVAWEIFCRNSAKSRQPSLETLGVTIYVGYEK
jgi:hypothetical protein